MKRLDACDHLDLDPTQAADPIAVRAAYAAMVKADHPDHGGTGERLAKLKAARDALLQSQDDISPCKLCRGKAYVKGRFGAQTCTACGGTGDQR